MKDVADDRLKSVIDEETAPVAVDEPADSAEVLADKPPAAVEMAEVLRAVELTVVVEPAPMTVDTPLETD